MPKRVADGERRVPLNCLVLPGTLAWLKSAEGSQGELVDRAVAVLCMQETQGRIEAFPAAEPRRIDKEATEKAVESGCDTVIFEAPKLGPFKAPLLKSKHQAESWRRGPRPKGDKSR